MFAQFHTSIESIGKASWDQSLATDYPFLRYEFLSALESNAKDYRAACCAETGWQPYHLALATSQDEAPLAIIPLYLKGHSYGEYVFDWAWADAYERNGQAYYPKLLCAIPFTPSTGPRILTREDSQSDQYQRLLSTACSALIKECENQEIETAHCLFSSEQDSKRLEDEAFIRRESVQFHWFNQDSQQSKYESFEHFLSQFKSRKRKAVKKERREVEGNHFEIARLKGNEIEPQLWDSFFQFYQNTYARRSGHGGYLPKHFFKELAETMPENILMVIAFKNSAPIAAALNFVSQNTLYGRYWGCTEEAEFLHFELCYYQGIEYCIENGIQRFDAGAQGEHKVQRGFVPVRTYSNHWIAQPNYKSAIKSFIDREAQYNDAYIDSLSKQLPFNASFELEK